MNRTTQRKLSRALVGGLGVTVALGGVFWLGQVVGSKSNATPQQHARAERGETSEEAVAAKSASKTTAGAGASSDDAGAAGAGATTKPSNASDPFAAQLNGANVLQTPTSPVALASNASPVASSAAPAPSSLANPTAGATNEPSAPTAPATPLATTTDSSPEKPDATPAAALPDARAEGEAKVKEAAQLAAAGAAGAERNAAQQDLIVGNPLADAKQKLEHGKTLEARRILNAAITDNGLSDADLKTAKQMLAEINQVVVFSSKQFKDDEFGGTFVVPPGGVLEKIAKSHDISTELLKRINGITDPRRLRAGQPLKVIKGPFNAVVDKSDFSLELWIGEPGARGSMYVTTLPVGLGADDSTPTGVWAVQNRLPNPAYFSPRGEGVIAADDPKNPLGEFWVGLTGTEGDAVGKESYGIHGTIEPDTIGKQASLGCIRLLHADIERVYEAVVPGKSTVTVRE